MAAVALTYTIDEDPLHLGGNRYLVTGEITTDTGDYASNGIALTASNFLLDSFDRVIVGKPSIIRTSAYWVKSTGKLKIFVEDAISGIEAEHPASALTAQSIPFVIVGRKAA